MCKIGYCCTLIKTRTAAHSWFDLINSLFFVFPSEVWCKINKLLKYYEYQLTKSCLNGRLEGFKVSSWFLKVMKVVEYRIAKTDTLTSYFYRNSHIAEILISTHSMLFHSIKQSLIISPTGYLEVYSITQNLVTG